MTHNKITATQRMYNYDVLRIVAIAFVVFNHVLNSMRPEYGTRGFYLYIVNINLVRFTTCVLFMISGMFMLDSKRASNRKSLKKHSLRLFTSFVFWSAIYVCIRIAIGFYKGQPLDVKKYVKQFFIGEYHLWFLLSLILIYISIPLLVKFFNLSKKTQTITLSISFAMLFIITATYQGIMLSKCICYMFESVSVINFAASFLYFLLGYYLKDLNLKRFKKAIYIIGFAAIASIIIMSYIFSSKYNDVFCVFQGNSSIFIFAFSLAVFTFFKEDYNTSKMSDRKKQLVAKLSEYSFGVYLIHPAIIFVFEFLGAEKNPMLSTPLNQPTIIIYSIAITALSTLITLVLYKIIPKKILKHFL